MTDIDCVADCEYNKRDGCIAKTIKIRYNIHTDLNHYFCAEYTKKESD